MRRFHSIARCIVLNILLNGAAQVAVYVPSNLLVEGDHIFLAPGDRAPAQIQYVRMRWDGMGWDGMGWDGMG